MKSKWADQKFKSGTNSDESGPRDPRGRQLRTDQEHGPIASTMAFILENGFDFTLTASGFLCAQRSTQL